MLNSQFYTHDPNTNAIPMSNSTPKSEGMICMSGRRTVSKGLYGAYIYNKMHDRFVRLPTQDFGQNRQKTESESYS